MGNQFAETLMISSLENNVFICVSSFNPGAQRLYENLGYQVVGAMSDFVIAGESEFLLRKTPPHTRSTTQSPKEPKPFDEDRLEAF